MKSRLKLIPLVVFCLCAFSNGQLWSGLLDPTRAIDWTQAGISGGIPSASWAQCTSGACATANSAGTSATLAQLNAALTTCGSNGNQYLLLASGTYTLTGTLNVPSNCVLRGAGPQATVLTTHGSSRLVSMGAAGSAPSTSGQVNLTGGGSQGSTSLTVSSATGFSVGNLLILAELDSVSGASEVGVGGQVCSWCDLPWNGTRSLGQIVRITSVSGTTIGISPPLYTTYSTSGSNTVGIPYAPAAKNCGLENLQIYGNNTVSTDMVEISETDGCWMQNIEVNYTDAEFVRVLYGIHNEVRNNYFSGSFVHGAGSSDGTVFLGGKASANIIENNIIERTHTSILMNWGAAGNVVAYNYTLGDFSDTAYLIEDEDIATHGATPQFNLVEGNQAANVNFDAYWGSDFNNTLFRNWLSGVIQIACPGPTGAPGAGGNSPYPKSCAVSDSSSASALHAAVIQWGSAWPSVQNMRALELDFTDRNTNSVDNVIGSNGLAAAHPYDLTIGSPVSTSAQQNWSAGCPNRSYDSVSYDYNYGYAGATDGSGGCDGHDSTQPFSTRWRHLDYDYYLGSARNNDGNVPSTCGGACSTSAPIASFVHANKPSWWGSEPWPANGSDITGGLSAAAGHANNIPAASCYQNTTKTATGQLAFDANNCYGAGQPPPVGLSATVH